jgi:hypothetical protein
MPIQSDLKPITLEIEGSVIQGEYRIYAGHIEVISSYGFKSAKIVKHTGFAILLL